MPTTLQTARRHHSLSALLARRAVREARRARPRGPVAVTGVLVAHQVAQAQASERAIGEMLVEQRIDAPTDAALNLLAFTTDAQNFARMADAASDFDRLVESLVQDAGRAAESVATTIRPNLGHVRTLTPPSCSRCAVLAGRVYRYSEGFRRHPNCDCTMTPVREGDTTYAEDPLDLLRRGLVTDLSKADAEAIRDGADFGQVVNVRLRKASLMESGRVLARAGRPTPEGIYRIAADRDEAIALLARHGYIR